MATPRQQRATQNRRAVPNAANPTPAVIRVSYLTAVANIVQLYPDQPRAALVLKGVPQVVCQETLEAPTLATLSDSGLPLKPTILTLQYVTPIPIPATLRIDSYDPALRNRYGAWLPATEIIIEPNPLSPWPYNIIASTATTVDINCNGTNSATEPAPVGFSVNSGGTGSTITRLTELTFQIFFPGANINSGDIVNWNAVNAPAYDSTGAAAAGGNATV